ncbi:unnamed protein product [Candida verbasci]|uniref:Flavodoxin-like domain-containing protein n=1 Tax=Candida verbasci TaxID=1227364 RepID=A0A9W4TR55_9ASCO|nr:unnamed protein product [Candida verbasci]
MKVAIIYYSTYGHVLTLAKAVQKGIKETGASADLFQIPETLSPEVLQKMHAPEKPTDIPIATLDTLTSYDAFFFAIPTRYGSAPAQFFEYFAATGGLWAQGALYGKPAAFAVSTGTSGGGQEVTIRNTLSFLAHHGLIYIPLGYAKAFALQANIDEVHGGSPWGAGTFAGGDGSRQPSKLELEIATIQGKEFATSAAKFVSSSSVAKSAAGATNSKSTAPTTNANNNATTAAANDKSTGATSEKKSTTAAPPRAQQSTKAPESTDKSSCSKCIIM